MGTTLLRLSNEDLELVEHLAPIAIMEKLELPHYYGVIAVDDEVAAPVGLVVYSYARAHRLDVEWLYVFETLRGEGIGSELLEMVFSVAQKSGVPYVGLRLEGDFASEENVTAMQGFASAFGFSYGGDQFGDWRITESDYDSTAFSKLMVDTSKVFPCAKVDENLIKAYLQKHYESLKNSPLYDYNTALKVYDKNLSVAYINKGEIKGILLVQNPAIDMYVIAFDAKNPKVAGSLIEGMRQNLKKEPVDPLAAVHVLNSPRAMKLLPDLFMSLGAMPSYMMVADANSLDKVDSTEEFFDDDVFAKTAPVNYRWLKTETYGDVAY